MKSLTIIILFFCFLAQNSLNAQNYFKNAEWNWHFVRAGLGNSYHHLNTSKIEKDTIINGDTFAIVLNADNSVVDYLSEKNGVVYYFFNKEVLKLFDFTKPINDSFTIDYRYKISIEDSIIKDVWVKITRIDSITNTTKSGYFKRVFYSIISDNILKLNGYGDKVPFYVPTPIVEKIILTNLSDDNTIRLSTLYNPITNTGSDTKPILSCYNSNSPFGYKDSIYTLNNYHCNYTTGVREVTSEKGIRVFPNPSNHFIALSSSSSNLTEYNELSIYNNLGQIMINRNNILGDVDISNFESGVYYLVLSGEEGLARARFVKQ